MSAITGRAVWHAHKVTVVVDALKDSAQSEGGRSKPEKPTGWQLPSLVTRLGSFRDQAWG
jgi:hypothetical protein